MSVKKVYWYDPVLEFGFAVLVAIWAWSNRPWEMRGFTEVAIATITKSEATMLKPWAFYAAMLLVVALVVTGIRQLFLLQQASRQQN